MPGLPGDRLSREQPRAVHYHAILLARAALKQTDFEGREVTVIANSSTNTLNFQQQKN